MVNWPIRTMEYYAALTRNELRNQEQTWRNLNACDQVKGDGPERPPAVCLQLRDLLEEGTPWSQQQGGAVCAGLPW